MLILFHNMGTINCLISDIAPELSIIIGVRIGRIRALERAAAMLRAGNLASCVVLTTLKEGGLYLGHTNLCLWQESCSWFSVSLLLSLAKLR